VSGAADSNKQGSPSAFRPLSQRSGERIPPFPQKTGYLFGYQMNNTIL